MNEINPQNLARYIQYTNVRPEATRDEIIAHAERTQEFGFNAAMIAMGTTIIWRSSDFSFEYSIITNHSFPEVERAALQVPLAGRAIRPAEVSWASAQVAPAAY